MDDRLTVSELETRWQDTLRATRLAATQHPCTYRELKALADHVVNHTIDIDNYFPIVQKLLNRLQRLDPSNRGSIFQIFGQRIKPASIWQVRQLRMECRDLLAHLEAFELWRRRRHHLKRIK